MAPAPVPATRPSPFELLAPRLDRFFHVESTSEWLEATRGTAFPLEIDAERRPVVLVEDPQTGVLGWAWPDPRPSRGPTGSGTTVMLPSGADRGVISTIGKKIVRALVPDALDAALRVAGERLVGLWEAEHRPERLVRFDPLTVGLPADDPGALATRGSFGDSRDEPVLLLVHGLGSLTRSGFDNLRGRGLSRLGARYGDRIVGFDHPTLATSPTENARSLARRLAELHDEGPLPKLEVLGFGRGGLVARALSVELDRMEVGIELERVWCVGTPNHGQPLASPDQLRTYLDRLTNLIGWLPIGAVGDVVDAVLATVAHVALGAIGGLDGITAMAPGSTTLAALNAAEPVEALRPRLYAVASNYVARPGTPLGDRAKALAAGHLLRGANDLLTTVESVFGPPDSPLVAPAHQRLFGDAHSVDHAGYFDHPATVEFVVDTDGSWRGGPPVTTETWRPTIHDEDGTIVSISVSHCSLEESQYAVMVGTYANESLAGAERFLDRQLGGELMARFRIDRYPAELGTSLFLPADDLADHATDPPGAYVVGLGSTIRLGRPELARTVRQALVDRCLRLYQGGPANEPSSRPASGVIEVGVSSTLMGVRNNDGLSVTESVAGVVEGVLEANRALVRYEATRSDSPTPVRITALEFVERYADRADRAVLAVRSLSSLVRLGPGYDELLHLTVDAAKRGGLPAGSSVNDNPQDWQRFVITGQPAGGGTDTRSLRLEITALGSDARADRLSHDLDIAVVDSLVERLGRNRSDQSASSTLFNFLVPDEIRPKFQTASAVQFVVDQHTANFPWELLSAPRAGQLRRLAESTSVVRQFTESDDRRLAPVRASAASALIIAAGNVSTLPKLPGVFQEAGVVEQTLRTSGRLSVSVLEDEQRPFDPAALMIETFGDHRILHIASHGEFVAGDPARTGAVLSDQLVLTAGKIRLLPFVPDLVFLNCCNLAQIGSNRMAAGLARELMAIGVRAVIAAGWPVGDAAAVAFAETFYEQYLGDASFGEAVARARLACAMAGGGETWAAYQCYGDPTLLFSGNSAAFDGAEVEPTSVDDLVRRLRSLEVQVSDLGRRGENDLEGRRRELRETLRRLTTWADDHGVTGRPHVGRQIGVVARLLNDFSEAAARFLAMVHVGAARPVSIDTIRLIGKEAAALDLQQAASCLARAGHARHRSGDASPDAVVGDPPQALATATALAEAACRMIGDRESHGILGGVLRRRAIVDPDHRRDHLDAAFRAYYTAATLPDEGGSGSKPGGYGYENARQFAALIGLPLPEDPPVAPETEPGGRRIDERRLLARDFWACASIGDRLLTELLRAQDPSAAARLADRVVEAYEAAFSTRSSFSDRNTAVDQVDCLSELARHDERAAHLVEPLARVVAGLQHWRADAVTATSRVEGGESAEPERSVGSAALELHVVPAGKGDMLVIEYLDRDTTRRIWIDGGVSSAYEKGARPFIEARGGVPLHVDVLVCTHIDSDHVAGAIELLEQGAVAADDIWFNGLAQLQAARGVKQGDEFESLIPPAARNRAVQGRPMFVPDDGALPVIQLAGGPVCTLLSPDGGGLDALLTLWKRQTRRDGEIGTVTELLDEFAADEAGAAEAERGGAKVGVDRSVPNRSSIAFLLEHRGRSLLLTGDAHAPVLQRSIERLLANRRVPKLRVDVVKLSHHSSRNNVSAGLLELLDCDAFVVCSSGNDDHPDVEGLRLVRAKFPDAAYYFSDDTAVVRERAAAAGITAPLLPGSAPHRIRLPARG